MYKYFLSNKAIDDLSKIWDNTYEVWSKIKLIDIIMNYLQIANS